MEMITYIYCYISSCHNTLLNNRVYSMVTSGTRTSAKALIPPSTPTHLRDEPGLIQPWLTKLWICNLDFLQMSCILIVNEQIHVLKRLPWTVMTWIGYRRMLTWKKCEADQSLAMFRKQYLKASQSSNGINKRLSVFLANQTRQWVQIGQNLCVVNIRGLHSKKQQKNALAQMKHFNYSVCSVR